MTTVRSLEAAEVGDRLEALADVLVDCVEGGASVSFMWPMTREKALAFWRSVVEGVATGERVVLVAEDAAGGLVGTIQLIMAWPENQPHRADVAKLLVRRSARRRGVARRLLDALEAVAVARHKTVLVLDTVTGGDAERVYERAGWQRVGSIPEYALMPDGAFCATTYFYKRLVASSLSTV